VIISQARAIITSPIKAEVILFLALVAASALPAEVIKVRPARIRIKTAAMPASIAIILTAVFIVSKMGLVAGFLASTQTVLVGVLLQAALKGSKANTFTYDAVNKVMALRVDRRVLFIILLLIIF
jgi:hypothetical protein